jgi:spindle assembly abnormal protein 6
MIVNFPTPSKQQIVINITDPQDPLFLYILEIGEGEFHFLKQELSLLIEFQHFPQKFFEMLELCTGTYNNTLNNNEILMNKSMGGLSLQSSYVSILHHNTSTNEALLIIQEITQFRQLNHLILRFKPASDSNLKKYLGNLVKDYKSKSESLQKDNSRLNENLESCYKDLKIFKDEVNTIKISHNSEIENLKIEHMKEVNELKRLTFEDHKSKLEQKEGEKQNLISEYENKIDDLMQKLNNLTNEKLQLEDYKIKLEASERDLIGKNSIISSELRVYKEEVENLRSTTTNLNQTSFSQEKYLTELKIKSESLQSQLDEKEKNIVNLTHLVDNLNKQKSDLEDSYKSLKSTNNKLEDKLQASIAEINKGNEIIQKIQGDLKAYKEKMKIKQQAIKAQEQLINQKQISSEDLIKNINELKREVERKEEEVKSCKSTLDLYKLKIEEGEKKLEENSNVISYLNQRLNESYMPFKTLVKGDTLNNINMGATFSSGFNNLGSTGNSNNLMNNINTNVPISSVRNLRERDRPEETAQIENNKFSEFQNTGGSSFGKQAYFNSLAFQSQGSFNNNFSNPVYNLNTQSQNQSQGSQGGNMNSYNFQGMILPETNFTNYSKNLPGTSGNLTKEKSFPVYNNNGPLSNTLTSNKNTTSGNLLSKCEIINLIFLGHKYGNTSSKIENNYSASNTQQSQSGSNNNITSSPMNYLNDQNYNIVIN